MRAFGGNVYDGFNTQIILNSSAVAVIFATDADVLSHNHDTIHAKYYAVIVS